MKVAFYLENRDVPDVDFRQPALGNPGCGGTEYLFSALPYYLKKLKANECQPIILANHTHKLPENAAHFRVADVFDAARRAKEAGCAFFVYRPRRQPNSKLLVLIDSLQIPTIAWAHITPTSQHLREMARTRYIKAIVCVELEQHDLAQDTAIWSKLTCIVNGFDLEGFRLANRPKKDPDLVVYIGALVRQKGFHVLAKAWPRILRRHPEARLAVIGSGALYNAGTRLGPWGVAEPEYEERFIAPYLAGPDGQPLPSVKFHGKLGLEKKEILHRAIVGVPNPSGQTENCPGTALEIQACGTAVVSGAYYGILDTVRDGETGLLGRTEDDLVANICTLLENPASAEALGRNGICFVEERYNYDTVTAEWCALFNRLKTGERPTRFPFKKNLHRHHKFLIYINRFFQIALGRFVSWPSVIEIKSIIVSSGVYRTLKG